MVESIILAELEDATSRLWRRPLPYAAIIPIPHNRPNTNPMRPAEAQLTDLIPAPVDEEEDAAAEALIEGDDIPIDVVGPAPVLAPDEVAPAPMDEAEADADAGAETERVT